MRYVQHKNDAQGPRYRLVENHWNREFSLGGMLANSWEVYNEDSFRTNLFLPRAEYILCNAPDVWNDVTARVTVANDGRDLVLDGCQWRAVYNGSTDRFRKVQGLLDGGPIGSADYHWAFVIEQQQ